MAQHRDEFVILGIFHDTVEVASLVEDVPDALCFLLEVGVELLAIEVLVELGGFD